MSTVATAGPRTSVRARWPYSFISALESGRAFWGQLLDALRLGPADDVAEVTAAQVHRVVEDLIEMGR